MWAYYRDQLQNIVNENVPTEIKFKIYGIESNTKIMHLNLHSIASLQVFIDIIKEQLEEIKS